MAGKKRTWAEKMATGAPHVEVLARPFAGAPAGAKLLVSSPMEVDAYLSANVPSGTTTTVRALREALAKAHGADTTCPMSTSIFVRIVAENAWDLIEGGTPITEVTPFWRVVDPGSPLAKKLRSGSDWIAHQREAEARSPSILTA